MSRSGAVRELCVGAVLLAALAAGCSESYELPEEEALRIRGVFQRGLESPDPWVRAETVQAVGMVGSPQLNDLLVGAVGDSSRMVRLGAVVEASRTQPGSVRAPMIDALTDSDEGYRLVAIEELLTALPEGAERGEVIALGLKSSSGPVRLRVVEQGLGRELRAALAAKDKEREREARAVLSRAVDDADPMVAGEALRLLGEGERMAPLVEKARSGDPLALRALAAARLPSARPTLEAARDKGGPGQVEALVGLAALGDEGAVEQLREPLGGASEELASRMVAGLGWSGSTTGLRILRPLRDDSRPAVRAAVYRAMGRHRTARSDDFLRGARDEAPQVGMEAIIGLVRSNPSSTASALRTLLGQEEHRLRTMEAALSALVRLELDGEAELRDALLAELDKLGPELTKLVGERAPDVRAAAAELLFLGPSRFERFQALTDPPPEARFAWIAALAAHPPEDEPLRYLKTFKEVDGSMTVLEVVAGAGIWNAYRVGAEGTPAK